MKIKLLKPGAVVPTYATDGSAGLDLYLMEDVVLPPIKSEKLISIIPMGFAVEIPFGYEGQIRPRSSTSKLSVYVMGTIDSDYRGEVSVMAVNLNFSKPIIFRKGERIAQMVITPVRRVIMEVVDELSPTLRGAGGFGSTGK